MIRDPNQPPLPPEEPPVPRVFVFEPGWHVAQKAGSDREFCYMTAPGQDYYHRLLDGELYLHHGGEKLCLPCAARRGLLSFEPRSLRDRAEAPGLDATALPPDELPGLAGLDVS